MRDKLELIERVKGIIKDYEQIGKLTVRQIHYRIFAQAWAQYPNTESSYNWLKSVLGDARLEGAIPWEAIEDRTREIKDGHGMDFEPMRFFKGYYDYLKSLDTEYTMPRWWGQPTRVQVWVEKEALASVFENITKVEGVDLLVLRGYPSLTLLWEDAERLSEIEDGVKKILILYFGDFDPSGMDIQRSAIEHIEQDFGITIECKRVALTQDQIIHYGLPPAPAKHTDTRRTAFIAEHGVDWQVELDSIDPRELQRLIEASIHGHWNLKAGLKRKLELDTRQRKIKRLLDKALNPSFEMPTGNEGLN
jgi:hypothetical protein